MPYLGEIRLIAGVIIPDGWQVCDGTLLPIKDNTALFELLKTRYGGDGVTNFAVPNFSGRIPIGAGQGNGLTARSVGDTGGSDSVTLTESQLPKHTHPVRGTTSTPTVFNTGILGAGLTYHPNDGLPLVPLAQESLSAAPPAAALAHENQQPSLRLDFVICTNGAWPG